MGGGDPERDSEAWGSQASGPQDAGASWGIGSVAGGKEPAIPRRVSLGAEPTVSPEVHGRSKDRFTLQSVRF